MANRNTSPPPKARFAPSGSLTGPAKSRRHWFNSGLSCRRESCSYVLILPPSHKVSPIG